MPLLIDLPQFLNIKVCLIHKLSIESGFGNNKKNAKYILKKQKQVVWVITGNSKITFSKSILKELKMTLSSSTYFSEVLVTLGKTT